MKLLADRRKKAPRREGRSRKGDGSLRLRNGLYYYRIPDPDKPGRQIEKTCATSDYTEAARVKNAALARAVKAGADQAATGPPVAEILSDYLESLEQKARYRAEADPDYDASKSMSGIRGAIHRITQKLGAIAAEKLTTADTDNYRRLREKGDGVAFTTVNHELAYLRAAFRRAMEVTPPKVARVPKMWFPSEESRVREGFIEREKEYALIFHKLPESLKAKFVIGFHTGARSGELGKIRWPMVDFRKGLITIRPKTAKNKNGRYLPIWGDMAEVLQWQKQVHDRECPESPWVFFWHQGVRGRAVPGARLPGTSRQFKEAAAAAGCPDFIFHDLRRSGIKYANQEAGIDRQQCMLMSGHKSESIFIRYNISGQREMVTMAAALDQHLRKSGGRRGLHLVEADSRVA